ncbi:MAG: cyclic nucleotide-binding domain-containing protein [Chloroflexi bacterium]|nr:cyclic nucleotide-binding domain-containing protein [Chloroflexota bacterium]
MSGDLKLELLAGVPLFARCSRSAVKAIAGLVDEVDVPDGKVLLREGDMAHEFFLILEGRVRIERGGQVLGRLGPGEFMGEIALIDKGPRTATATAERPGRVGVLARREFHSLLDAHPDVRIAVLEALARRVRHLEPDRID